MKVPGLKSFANGMMCYHGWQQMMDFFGVLQNTVSVVSSHNDEQVRGTEFLHLFEQIRSQSSQLLSRKVAWWENVSNTSWMWGVLKHGIVINGQLVSKAYHSSACHNSGSHFCSEIVNEIACHVDCLLNNLFRILSTRQANKCYEFVLIVHLVTDG